MRNTYVIESASENVLQSKYVLLDTNFLIDASAFKKEAADLFVKLKALVRDLLVTRPVVLETLGGTKDEDDLKGKVAYLEAVFGRPFMNIIGLPIERDLPAKKDILDFSRQCNKFSQADFELFLTLRKYKSSGTVLVTRDHTDFTSKICERVGFITLLGDKEIRTYGIYRAK